MRAGVSVRLSPTVPVDWVLGFGCLSGCQGPGVIRSWGGALKIGVSVPSARRQVCKPTHGAGTGPAGCTLTSPSPQTVGSSGFWVQPLSGRHGGCRVSGSGFRSSFCQGHLPASSHPQAQQLHFGFLWSGGRGQVVVDRGALGVPWMEQARCGGNGFSCGDCGCCSSATRPTRRGSGGAQRP